MEQSVVVLNGPMGSGKTTVAAALKTMLPNTAFISIDKIKWFVSDFQRTKEQNEVAFSAVIAMSSSYLNDGLSLVFDQGLIGTERLNRVTDLAKANKARFFHFRLEAPKQILIERIEQRPKPELAPKKLPMEKAIQNIDAYFAQDRSDGTVIDTSILSTEQIATEIFERLQSH